MGTTRIPSTKTLCKQAIISGNIKLALELLKLLENPRPKRLRGDYKPYRFPYTIV